MKYIISEDSVKYVDDSGKELAVVDFPAMNEHVVNITHTFVDDSLRGLGIAGKITEIAVVYLKTKGKKIVLTCSYAQAWFKYDSNAIYRSLLAE